MISAGAKFKVFLGSFFIQASWSFKRMQGLGFSAALSPALTEIYADKAKRLKALKRHTAYYNAHPYMASPVLGAVINIEEQACLGGADTEEAVSLKEALMGPYGSLGDGFFWGAVRPVAALAGILATLFLGLLGPVIFLALYNLFHLPMRWRGLGLGLKYGSKVIEKVAVLELPVWSIRLRLAGAALLGVISTLLMLSALGTFSIIDGGAEFSSLTLFFMELLLVIVVLVINIFIVGRLALQRLIYAVIVPALILGLIVF